MGKCHTLERDDMVRMQTTKCDSVMYSGCSLDHRLLIYVYIYKVTH